jgi:hypothetical protein
MAEPKFAPRPDHVFIHNHTYEIKWMNAEEWQRGDYSTDEDGLTYNDRGLILMRLVPDRLESMYQETLMHEIMHAIWCDTGLSLHGDWDSGEIGDKEEYIILRTSPSLVFMLKNNPHVTKYLLADGNVRR